MKTKKKKKRNRFLSFINKNDKNESRLWQVTSR